MNSDRHAEHKALLAPLRAAMSEFDSNTVRAELAAIVASDANIRLSEPFGTVHGPGEWLQQAYAPLLQAWPDLERRDWIVVAGADEDGADWVGCAGHYLGTFAAPWLDIPPTGHVAAMRFHEFYRFENGQVVEVQAIWDVPEVMQQAGAWPLAPALGRSWQVPGPATQDGLVDRVANAEASAASREHVIGMLTDLCRHPSEGGPEVMNLERWWHPRFNWYGPAGIGTARGISGFRHWHQIPFLAAMPDRSQHPAGTSCHFFAEDQYVAVTGWPNMAQTLSAAGWLGLPPTGQRITLRSLDFWRLERGLIRENWVLVDLLDLYTQLGIDALGRMREFNKARTGFSDTTGVALA